MSSFLLKNQFIKRITAIFLAAVLLLLSFCETITVLGNEGSIVITSQPKSMEAQIGDAVTFTVKALGNNLSYNWQHSGNGGSSWSDTPHAGNNTDTMTVSVKSFTFNMLYRCEITDSLGNTAYSDICKAKNENDILSIKAQPQNTFADKGESVTFSVDATGLFVNYNWQISSDDGNTWRQVTFPTRKKAQLTFVAENEYMNCKFRCVLTDYYGNTIISNEATLFDNSPTSVVIIAQPKNAPAEIGETATFTVKANGTGLRYQWQHSGNGGYTWNDTPHKGYDTDTIVMNVKSFSYKMLYRCIITDALGNTAITDRATVISKTNNTFSISTNDYEAGYSLGYKRLVGPNEFAEKSTLICEDNKTKAAVSFNTSISVKPTDLIILKITAIADTACGKLNFSVNNGEVVADYPVYTQKADYYIPIANTSNISSVLITLKTTYQSINISDFQIVNFGNSPVTSVKTGVYLRDAADSPVKEDSAFGAATTASVSDGRYLYSVCKGVLTVYDITGDSPAAVTTVNKLGTCHDIALLNNGKALVVTSRENGAYFIDISDPTKPVIASKYATLEMATGLATSGGYTFICSRYFGVEIIDSTDIYNPKYYSQISNFEEMYDCCVDDNYLYIGVWGQKKIQIYDITDLRKPTLANTILLDGNAGGIDIKDSILCVATGYHSRNTSTSVSSTGFGMGNGIEIYDISNAKNPKWLSSCKIDGRYKYTGYDYWKVKISGKYAVLASTYCGAYIYDISNPTAPIRKEHIPIIIEKSSPNYKAYTSGSFIFNFDTTSYNQAPLISIATSENKLFFGDPITGIYQKTLLGAQSEKEAPYSFTGSDPVQIDLPEIEGYTSSIYNCDSSVYVAREYNNLIYVGCGTGIRVLSSDLELLSEYKTNCAVKDMAITRDGKYLYTAECDDGVCVYSINNENIVKLGATDTSTAKYDFAVTSLSLSANEKYILCQAGFSRMGVVVNISNKSNPVLTTHTAGGTMYYRNLCSGIIGGKYNASADSGKITIYSEGTSSLVKDIQLTNSVSSEVNGLTAYGDNIIYIYSNGYIYFNPLTEESNLKTLKVNKINGVMLKGKPVANNGIMVVSNCPTGELTIVDISNIDSPRLITNIKLNNASLDVASISHSSILIPMRNNGLIKLSKEV